MSKSHRAQTRDFRRTPRGDARESFRCGHCGAAVGPVIYGGSHRNHCPYCLYSRHVDNRTSGDRLSDCRGLMEPIGAFTRPKGEHVVVHLCLTCGLERHNRIAGDDDFELVLKLPVVAPRVDRPSLYSSQVASESTPDGQPQGQPLTGPVDGQ